MKDQCIVCLLGDAIRYALNAPINFRSSEEIYKKYRPAGLQDTVDFPVGLGRITNDTKKN